MKPEAFYCKAHRAVIGELLSLLEVCLASKCQSTVKLTAELATMRLMAVVMEGAPLHVASVKTVTELRKMLADRTAKKAPPTKRNRTS